jgi:hypothetical protein
MADTKTYTILSVALVFVGFLVSFRPWMFITGNGRVFFAVALGLYVGVVLFGIWSYFPREFPATNTRAILEELDRPNETLMRWTSNALLDFADRNWRIALEKGFWIRVTIVLFVIATLSLSISLVTGR